MIKLFSRYFPKRTVLLAAFQTLLVFTLLPAAALVDRTRTHGGVPLGGMELLRISAVGLICLSCFYYQDLYKPGFITESHVMAGRLIRALGIASIALAILYVVFPAAELNGAIVGIWLIGAGSAAIHYVFLALNRSNRRSAATLVIGDGYLASQVMHIIQSRSELGLNLVGYLGGPSRSTLPHGITWLGPVESLPQMIKDTPVQRVIVAMSDRRAKLPVETLLDLKMAGLTVQEGAEFYELATGRIPVDTIRPSWLIFGPGFRVSRLRSFYKRLMSVTIAIMALLAFSPIMAIIALAIWIDSPGPIIFRQVRIGMHGMPFTLYKFRTMYDGADRGKGALPVQVNDRRVTRVGLWLRRFRLDELPQLYNILAGHMSLVGPRPFVPNQELELAERIPLYKQRWAARPGATGWAQVQRGYCATLEDNVEKLAYDLFYIKNMSLGLDLLIVLKTIKVVLAGIGGR